MEQIEKKSFIINAESQAELLDRLLELNNYTRQSFATYMGVEADILDETPQWAVNYLSDITEANFLHLGYVAKDAKHEGVLGEYREEVARYKEIQNDRGDLQQPVIINEEYILSSVRTLKVSYLANSQNMIRNYLDQQ